ncbi:hypothetical protein ACFZCK_14180 [Kitasatospora purpeofusca]|uniref:hypothetical protein n=1 Tax=Kitasatospora purpeofusca TaxID=67352 RepID=UPI0036E0E75B
MARVEVNRSEFQRLAQGPEAYAALMVKARQVLARAQATAPRDSGDYAGRFHISGGKTRENTAIVYVGNDDPAAAHIEWGTKKGGWRNGPSKAHHTMSRALGSVVEE